MISLRIMTSEEFRRFKEYSIADYAKDLFKGRDLDWKQALADSEEEFVKMLPEGEKTEGQFLMTIEDVQKGREVGWIWFYYETEDGVRQVWLSDFMIHEDERRKGCATAALNEMERMAKNDGCAVSALLVWDHNPAGYGLYRKSGYVPVRHIEGGSVMKKDLLNRPENGEMIMDKKAVLETLDAFPYDREAYWVVAGAAMVLYGIREHTRDIDLGCNERMADSLERDGFLCGYTDSGGRRFKYGEHIEVFENWLKDSVTAVEGFPVVTVRGLLEMKRELGREKDIRDIRLIDEYLKRTDADPYCPEL